MVCGWHRVCPWNSPADSKRRVLISEVGEISGARKCGQLCLVAPLETEREKEREKERERESERERAREREREREKASKRRREREREYTSISHATVFAHKLGTCVVLVPEKDPRLHGCCWETFYIFAYCGLVVEIKPLNC